MIYQTKRFSTGYVAICRKDASTLVAYYLEKGLLGWRIKTHGYCFAVDGNSNRYAYVKSLSNHPANTEYFLWGTIGDDVSSIGYKRYSGTRKAYINFEEKYYFFLFTVQNKDDYSDKIIITLNSGEDIHYPFER